MSPLGDDFPKDKFLRTPISTINNVLHKMRDEEMRKANTASLTNAHIAHLVINIANSFAGSKRGAPKIKPKDFLPFPDWQPKTAPTSGADSATQFVLGVLISRSQIPLHVFSALMGKADQPT